MKFVIDYLSKLPLYLLLLLSALSVIGGDFFGKYWSLNRENKWYIVAFICYFFSGFFYLPSLVKHGLVVTSVIWSLLSIIGFLFIGFVVFKEKIGVWYVAGVVLGVLALVVFACADYFEKA